MSYKQYIVTVRTIIKDVHYVHAIDEDDAAAKAEQRAKNHLVARGIHAADIEATDIREDIDCDVE